MIVIFLWMMRMLNVAVSILNFMFLTIKLPNSNASLIAFSFNLTDP